MALKELEARYATIRAKDYKLTDGEGLYLFVRANGFKLWRFKYRYAGKEKLLSFGPYAGRRKHVIKPPARRRYVFNRAGS